jgi:hypothetical protein
MKNKDIEKYESEKKPFNKKDAMKVLEIFRA